MATSHQGDHDHSSHPPKDEKATSHADREEHHHTGNGWALALLVGVLIGLAIWGGFSVFEKTPIVNVTAPPATVQVTIPTVEPAPETELAPPATPPPVKKPRPKPPQPPPLTAPAPTPSPEVVSVKYCSKGYTQVQSVGYAVCLKWPVTEAPDGRAAVSWVSLQDTSMFTKPGSATAPAGRVEWIPLVN